MVGFGGLGHVAVQILKALTPARVLAVDEAYARACARDRSMGVPWSLSASLIANDGNERR